MSRLGGIGMNLGQPARGSVLSRNLNIFGSITRFNGAILSASIQFGAGGPSFSMSHSNISWGWTGQIPNNIRPGQSFQIIVEVYASMIVGQTSDGPIVEPADGQLILDYVLENIAPALTV